MHTVIIVGLPGSGKSHFASSLAKEMGAALVDDPKFTTEVPECDEPVVLVDMHLCRADEREHAASFVAGKRPGTIEWIFFANDPEQCIKNVSGRLGQPVHDWFIRRLSGEYVIPEHVVVRPVWAGGEAITSEQACTVIRDQLITELIEVRKVLPENVARARLSFEGWSLEALQAELDYQVRIRSYLNNWLEKNGHRLGLLRGDPPK